MSFNHSDSINKPRYEILQGLLRRMMTTKDKRNTLEIDTYLPLKVIIGRFRSTLKKVVPKYDTNRLFY